MRKIFLICLLMGFLSGLSSTVSAGNIVYIHGDVSECGTVPSANETGNKKNGQPCSTSPYDQMLLTDSGRTGLSQFKTMVEDNGHTIEQQYDQAASTTLDAQWFAGVDVVIFGLHQRIWNSVQKQALDEWLRAGGGVFIYSDSASGGRFSEVGAQNPVGQTVTNNLIADYGLQVTVDQADGTTGHDANATASIPGVAGLRLEGEGVSPAAVAPSDPAVEILIPYDRNVNKRQGLTISNPDFAALAMTEVGAGHIVVMFDRQPMWNNGPGSDINEEDNREILRNVVNFLAERPSEQGDPPADPPSPPSSGDKAKALGGIYLLLQEN